MSDFVKAKKVMHITKILITVIIIYLIHLVLSKIMDYIPMIGYNPLIEHLMYLFKLVIKIKDDKRNHRKSKPLIYITRLIIARVSMMILRVALSSVVL